MVPDTFVFPALSCPEKEFRMSPLFALLQSRLKEADLIHPARSLWLSMVSWLGLEPRALALKARKIQ